MDYKSAQETLGARKSKKLQNNTYLVHGEKESFAVRLHDTEVLTFFPDGSIILNTDGWLTLTTKDRMNTYLPKGYRILQEKRVWYLAFFDGKTWIRHCVYQDDMQLVPIKLPGRKSCYTVQGGLPLDNLTGAPMSSPKSQRARGGWGAFYSETHA
jgi:hypothetical protein